MNIEAVKSALINLAIRGKLVPQRDDEPAVEQIGEAPKVAPFEIPAKWKWVKLDDVSTKITDGTHHSPKNSVSGQYFYVTAKNIKDSGISLENITYVSEQDHNEIYARCNPEYGDVLYIKDGATTGVVTINNLREPFSLLSSVALIKPEKTLIDSKFIVFALRTKPLLLAMRQQMKGTGIPRVTLKILNRFLLPLPPLAEQRRIVAKLEELLEPLSRVQERLGRLTHDFPEQFKAAVLQKAIQGKLVPQRDDEPAVEQIGAAPEEAPFEIPVKWKWVKLPEILFFQEGPGILAVDFKPEGVPLIRLAGVQGKYVTHAGCNFLDPQKVAAKWNHFKTELNDVVISSSASLDRVAVIRKDTVGNILYTGLIRFHPLAKGIKANIDMRWFIYFTQSQAFIDQINAKKTGATIKHFGPTHLKKMIIPLPPLAEQRRIVAKVEQLFSQVDELTARLSS